MLNLLDDPINLKILENLCQGNSVEVNISKLSKKFKKHRNTIKSQVDSLFQNEIINRPAYPFNYLREEFPIMVVARAEIPRTEKASNWLLDDKHIFAAFYVRDEEYDTLLIEYHKDLHSYGNWKKQIINDSKLPKRDIRTPAHALLFSNKDIIKYEPNSPITILEEDFNDGFISEINGTKINKLGIDILGSLMRGEAIRTNENQLSKNLNLHRKTVERRIKLMIDNNIIGRPICHFPRFYVPPNQLLVYYLMEIKREKNKMHKAIKLDPHINLAIEAGIGRYNLLMFGVFSNMDDHFAWEEKHDMRFKDCVGAMKKLYLTSKMAVPIDQHKVSLEIIRDKQARIKELESGLGQGIDS